MSTNLPVARIKTIMKSCPDVEVISHDSAMLVGKATELFIRFLTVKASEINDEKKIDYKDLAEIVQSDDRLDFLREMVPKKITVLQFKEILKQKKKAQFPTKSTESSVNGSTGTSEESDSDAKSNEEEEEEDDASDNSTLSDSSSDDVEEIVD